MQASSPNFHRCSKADATYSTLHIVCRRCGFWVVIILHFPHAKAPSASCGFWQRIVNVNYGMCVHGGRVAKLVSTTVNRQVASGQGRVVPSLPQPIETNVGMGYQVDPV